MKNRSQVNPRRRVVQPQKPAPALVLRQQRDACDEIRPHAEAVRAGQAALPSPDELRRTVDLFALLSNETRLRMLLALAHPGTAERSDGALGENVELCVCDLAAVAGASQSMTSHQLRLLREAGIVTHRRSGKLALYRITNGPVQHLLSDALGHVAAASAACDDRRLG